MICDDRARTMFAQCVTTHADTIGSTPEPRWGWILVAAAGLGGALIVDGALRSIRPKPNEYAYLSLRRDSYDQTRSIHTAVAHSVDRSPSVTEQRLNAPRLATRVDASGSETKPGDECGGNRTAIGRGHSPNVSERPPIRHRSTISPNRPNPKGHDT